MRGKSERVNRLIKEYMSDRQEGMSNEKIARKHGVSTVTLYKYLQTIADANGVSREELLYEPHKPYILLKKKESCKKEPINPKEVKEEFDKVLETISGIIEKISKWEKQEEQNENN